MRRAVAPWVFLLGFLAPVGMSATVYVNGSAGNDTWDGLCESWTGGLCGPKKTIQAGIDAANTTGDTVVLADGVYTGVGNTNLMVSGKELAIRSSGQPGACVIDLQNAASTPALQIVNSTPLDTIVHGLTIRGGSVHAVTITTSGTATIEMCVFEQMASLGVYAANYPGKEIRVLDCRFRNNAGPCISVHRTALSVAGCTFENNVMSTGPTCLDVSSADARLENCVFRENASDGYGAIQYRAGSDGSFLGVRSRQSRRPC